MRLPEFRRNGTPQPRQTAAHATLVWLSHQFGRHGVCAGVCVYGCVYLGAWMQLCKQCLHQNVKLKQIGMHRNGQNGCVIVTIALQEMSPSCT